MFKLVRLTNGMFKTSSSDAEFNSIESAIADIQKTVTRSIHTAFRDFIDSPTIEAGMLLEESMDEYSKWMRAGAHQENFKDIINRAFETKNK